MRRYRLPASSEVVLALWFALATIAAVGQSRSEEVASAPEWAAVVQQAGPAAGPTSRDDLAALKSMLNGDDRVATLEAVQFALDEVGDGATYIWHRKSGPLRGAVKPTGSFRGADGKVCRHIMMSLSLGEHTREVEGIACRSLDRRWSLAS